MRNRIESSSSNYPANNQTRRRNEKVKQKKEAKNVGTEAPKGKRRNVLQLISHVRCERSNGNDIFGTAPTDRSDNRLEK